MAFFASELTSIYVVRLHWIYHIINVYMHIDEGRDESMKSIRQLRGQIKSSGIQGSNEWLHRPWAVAMIF
jgi:hypothetical protein